jgi:hypothetical protein
MNPDFYSDLPNGEHDANALDRALDDFVRGRRRQVNRLEPELATTVDRIFALADVSGMPGATRTRPPRRLLPWKAGIPMKQVASVISTVAAVVILAIGINASVPGFRDQHAGLGTAVPTSDADEDSMVHPGTPHCNVKPRTRAELVELLSHAPTEDPYSGGTGKQVEGDIAALQESLDMLQSCWQMGDYWRAIAFLSDQYLRVQIYGSELIETPYSAQTINELIDGQIEIYNNRSMVDPGSTYPRAIIDSENVRFDESGVDATVGFEMILDDQAIDAGNMSATFVLVDGIWQIWWMSYPIVH